MEDIKIYNVHIQMKFILCIKRHTYIQNANIYMYTNILLYK